MSLESILSILEQNWPNYLKGAYITLLIAIFSTIIGALIGLFIGVMHTIPLRKKSFKSFLLKIVNFILSVYVEIFRGTPMIVQAMVVFYGIAAYGFVMDRFLAAILVVSLNTGAYMAEYVRGGIVSIEKGQYEAAEAIGMNHFQTMVHIILPQVIRNILPATGNQLIMNIKDSAVLSVISVTELFFVTKTIASINYKTADSYLIACVMYLIMTLTASQLLRLFEKKLDGPKDYNFQSDKKSA
ncbi:amino acid ABC transporter permease [Ureibacillus manganicus]|uniref:Amino acid ABC transporter substrate-binding protein n=1 Tax=Ureibacillus manganicus DSM 26584 TaxID=1384049 RepID=A0A0A3IVN3_9BACL|nr:amino acid ABC transporter permease [Ureibacillus manganicus]KGR78877.1 amino acid ABC transporter substrate-binding protein [Ureibacillus manganicus DSM 26584]